MHQTSLCRHRCAGKKGDQVKTAKLELNSLDASTLYRGLAAYERELRAELKDQPFDAALAFSIVSVEQLKDKVALIFERVRPIEKKKKGA